MLSGRPPARNVRDVDERHLRVVRFEYGIFEAVAEESGEEVESVEGNWGVDPGYGVGRVVADDYEECYKC